MLRIKQLRIENNMSQRALAAKINANQKTVNYWERGICEPSAGFIIQLANVFECTADYILGREDDFGRVDVMRELSDYEKELLHLLSALDKNEKNEVKNYVNYLISKK